MQISYNVCCDLTANNFANVVDYKSATHSSVPDVAEAFGTTAFALRMLTL